MESKIGLKTFTLHSYIISTFGFYSNPDNLFHPVIVKCLGFVSYIIMAQNSVLFISFVPVWSELIFRINGQVFHLNATYEGGLSFVHSKRRRQC